MALADEGTRRVPEKLLIGLLVCTPACLRGRDLTLADDSVCSSYRFHFDI